MQQQQLQAIQQQVQVCIIDYSFILGWNID
jgi:hypothetical protein